MPPTRTRPRGTTRRVQPFQGRPPAARRPARHRRCRCRTSCMTNGSDARSPVCCRPMRLQPQSRVFTSSSSSLPPFARTWLRQDARDAVAGRARHPDRPVADRDPDARFARPDGDWPAAYLPGASVDPGHGPVPPVCDPDAAIRESPGPTAGRAVTCGSRRPGRTKRFLHPVVGELDLTVESTDIHTSGHLTFWAATADSGSPSESALAALSATGVAGG